MACDMSKLANFSTEKQQLIALGIDTYTGDVANYVAKDVDTSAGSMDDVMRDRFNKDILHGEKIPGGRAHFAAHHLRYGDASGGRLLLGHRELFPLFRRQKPGRCAFYADGLLPERLSAVCGRVSRDAAAGARHV